MSLERVHRWLAFLLFASACGSTPPDDPSALLASMDVVDLTQRLGPDIPVFPGGPRFESETLVTVAHDGYYLNRFTTGEHTGTHVDAPAHFVEGARSVDAIPPATLTGPAAVIDVSEQVSRAPDHTLSREEVLAWEREYGRLAARDIVLVRTGWAARWPNEARYRNADARQTMHFPGVSVPASRLLRRRGVRAIGIDTLSTDPGPSTTFAQHHHFLAAGGYHIENLTNLERLPARGAIVVVGVLPIARGSGGPARVLALVPRSLRRQ